jgi:foldase protein PrsA
MKSTRIWLVVALIGALAAGSLLTSGCSNKDVAAKVNGETISNTTLNAQLDQLKKQYPTMFTGADGEGRLLDFKQRLLDNLINQTLIEQAAKQKGINVSDADIQKQIDQLKSGFKDQTQFEAALKSAGMTLATLQDQIRQQLVTNKLMDTLAASQPVTAAEIQAYYDKNKSQFSQKAQKRASHILFKPTDKATAEKVLKMLQAGTITFADAARKYSTDTATASKGGDLGWPTSAYVPEFQAALDKLSKGQISPLVQSTYGWHIITVTETRPAKQSTLDEVKSQIEQLITQQRKADAYQKFLEQLRAAAKIQVLVPDLQASGSKSSAVATPTSTIGNK